LPIIVLVPTVFVAVVAVGLWLTRNRGGRAFAAGLAGCWFALLIAVFGLWSIADDTSDDAPTLRDAGTGAYYLSKEVDGYPVNQNREAGDLGAAGVTVGYGQPCPEGPEGCFSAVEVSTLTFSREYVVTWGCERLAPVMGVPAVRRTAEFGGLLLFTGRVMVLIEADRKLVETVPTDKDVTREVALASRLRPLKGPAVPGSLRPPDPGIRTFVDDACGSQR